MLSLKKSLNHAQKTAIDRERAGACAGKNPSVRAGAFNREGFSPLYHEKKSIDPTMKTNPLPATAPQPSEDEIRDYANHLYVQHGSVNGHESDDWFEAEACLRANIPKESSRIRLHHHTQITERAALGLIKHGKS